GSDLGRIESLWYRRLPEDLVSKKFFNLFETILSSTFPTVKFVTQRIFLVIALMISFCRKECRCGTQLRCDGFSQLFLNIFERFFSKFFLLIVMIENL